MNLVSIIVVVLALFVLRWLWHQPKRVKIQWSLGFIIASLLFLMATGRLHWIIGAASALFSFIALLFRNSWLFRYLFQMSSKAQQRSNHQQRHSTKQSMSKDEAFKILGLEATATREEIIHAHKQLIQRMHPDRGGSPLLAQQINQAREVLLEE
ncbi:MAG: DnaJ domain-containing protein [Candidatus Oxydemutatoraceae bacterium WSBS_2016_MAG_OTU14]